MPTLKNVLLVEDDDIRSIAVLSLRAIGQFEVAACSSGKAALAELSQNMPHMIVMDVMMPELDGIDALAAIKANPAWSHLPVVFMTAKTQANEIAYFKSQGATAVIPKPFDPASLPEKLLSIWDKYCTAED